MHVRFIRNQYLDHKATQITWDYAFNKTQKTPLCKQDVLNAWPGAWINFNISEETPHKIDL